MVNAFSLELVPDANPVIENTSSERVGVSIPSVHSNFFIEFQANLSPLVALTKVALETT